MEIQDLNTRIVSLELNKIVENFLASNGFIFIIGIIAAFSMPGNNLAFIAWVGFVPLMLSLFNAKAYKDCVIKAFLFFFGFNLLNLSWILSIYPLDWAGLNPTQGVYLAYFIWILTCCLASSPYISWGFIIKFVATTKTNDFGKILFIAIGGILCSNIILSSLGKLSFPWSMIEYSQHNNLYFLQIAGLIKGIGLGFLIILVNTLFAFGIYKKQKRAIMAAATIILGSHLLGFLIYKHKPVKTPDNITLIKTNITVQEQGFPYYSIENLKKYYLDQIKKAKSGIVILPESSIADFLNENDQDYIEKLEEISKKQKKTIIIGYLNKHLNKINNSALVLDSSEKAPQRYDKIYLVPFGETLIFENLFPHDIYIALKHLLPVNYEKGKDVKVFETSNGIIAPSICYEVIFPELALIQGNKKPDLFVNLSNLGWFRSKQIKQQFAAFAKVRAVENSTPYAAAINTGNSFIIDSKGKITNLIEE